MNEPRVMILMGSDSDRSTVEKSIPWFEYFGIKADYITSSAHRNPEKTAELASKAAENGYGAIICAAGMAAHLAGMCTAHTDLPVIGIPLPGGMLDGLDALLSTVQMPAGVPVATLAVGSAGVKNAAVLCARIFALSNPEINRKLAEFRANGCKLPS